MCCSLAPAEFSKTIVFAGEAKHGRKTVHVNGYQNTAQHLGHHRSPSIEMLKRRFLGEVGAPKPAATEASGNAMIIPIPAKPRTMSPKNLVSSEDCPNILENMAAAVRSLNRRETLSADSLIGAKLATRGVQIFEHDIYTVVLADDARKIPAALRRLPPSKRPPLNDEVFSAYAKWYPKWTVAVCCFTNEEAARAKPLLWWYEPMNRKQLFIPGLDSHTGGVPDLQGRAKRDHVMAVSSCSMTGGAAVRYGSRERLSTDAALFMPPQVIGAEMRNEDPNCDWYCSVADVRKGTFHPLRLIPPGAR